MAALEYLTQNSLTAYPFKRSQPAGASSNNPIQDNWFYDILFVSFSPAIRSVYISSIEKTAQGDIHITFSNSETLDELGVPVIIANALLEDHLQNKLNSFVSSSNELFAVKIVLGPGLASKEAFSQTYSLSEAELVNSAIIPASPKLLNLTFKAYSSEILPGGDVQTTISEVKNFSFETSEPLIKLKHNISFALESASQGGLYIDAGRGTGLYDNCPTANEITEVYTLNNVSPNAIGALYISHAACHTLNTLSDNDKTYLTTTHQLDNYADELIVPGHSLVLQNFCKAKCPRENINAFAHYLNRVTDGAAELNEIAFNSIETRGKGTPTVAIFNVTDFCVESTEQDTDPFLRCSEHTEPVDAYIACNSGFRKYFHEFRTIQLFYDNLTVRDYTIVEVIDENSVRLDIPPTAGSALWFRIKDNGVISNMNCAAIAYNLLADSNTNPYFKVKYTTGETYDAEGNYVTLLAVNVALFNPSIKIDTSLEVSFTPTILTQQGYFKIRKSASVENSLTPTTTLGCKEYAFIEAVYRIPCGITGGQLDIEVFNTSDGGMAKIGSTYTIAGVDGVLCPGDVVTQSKSFRITKSNWQDFNTPPNKNYLNVGLGVIATNMLGDVPLGGWLTYLTSFSSENLYLTAAYAPIETDSKRYSIIFKNSSSTNVVTYARCVVDYVAPPTITAPLSTTYTAENPLILSKTVEYTSVSPALKIAATNMLILSSDFASDLVDFYYTAVGLPVGLELDAATGAVTGSIAEEVTAGENIEITLSAHNASGAALNPQTLYIKVAVQAPPELSFDSATPGPTFDITNFTTYTTLAPIYNLVVTNTPIYSYALYFTGTTTQLPTGLYFNTSTGTITGRVTELSSGTGGFEITATNIYGESVTRLAFTISYTVYSKPSITYPEQYDIIGAATNSVTTLESPLFTIEATQAFGGTDNYAEGLTDTTRNKYTSPAWNNVTGIPPGFYLDLYTGKFYGAISSSELPTDPLITSYVLNYPLVLTATNPIGTNSKTITVQISSVGVPVINTVSTKTVIRNTVYTEETPLFTITATNYPTSFSATGLPTGLVCSSTTGKITGSVTSSLLAGSYTVTLNASNDYGAATPLSCTVRLLISIASVSPSAPYNIVTGTYYSNIFTVTTSGVKPSDTVTLALSSTPGGLSFIDGILAGTPTVRGNYTLRVTASTQNYGSVFQDIPVSITTPSYTLEGTILNDLGSPVQGALITVSTDITATSGIDGKYTITNVPAGIYNVRATKASCISTPTYQRITIPPPVPTSQPDLDKIDFTVIGPLRTITGTVLRSGTDAPLLGLSVSDGFSTSITNSYGVFELSSSTNQLALNVTSTLYYFEPTIVPAGSASVSGIVIRGLPLHTVSGTITAPDTIVGNITIEATDTTTLQKTSVLATKSGNTATYTFKLKQGTYSMAPVGSSGIYIFSASPVVTTITGSRTINFTANVAYNISGNINSLAAFPGDADVPISGVTISTTGKSTTSDAAGSYTLSSLTVGTYTLTATKAGLVFPVTRQATISNNSVTGIDFHPTAYTISGAVYYTDPDVKIPEVTIKLRDKISNTLLRTVTSTNEGYVITNVPDGEYVISAEQAACTIVLKDSVDYDITISSADVENKDFTITAVAPVAPNEAQINSVILDELGALVVSFSLSVITSGSPVIRYDYSIDDGESWHIITDYVSSDSFKITSGIVDNTTYIVKIRTVNLYSNAVSDGYSITTPSAPAAPTINYVTTKAGGKGLNIYFTTGSDGGAAITKYEWRAKRHNFPESTFTIWTNTETLNDVTSPIVTTKYYGDDYFVNGDKYDIQIRAKNRIGYSQPSEELSDVGPADIPDRPSNTNYEIPVASASGALEAVYIITNNGGEAITDIEYRITPAGGVTSSVVSTGQTPDETVVSTITITGLDNGKFYTIEIRAVNILGKSEWLSYTPNKPGTNPVTPSITEIAPKDSAAVISFTEIGSTPIETPPNGGYTIKAYHFYFDKTSGTPDYSYYRTDWEAQNKTASPFVVGGLNNDQAYSVIIQAENDLNLLSELSDAVEITPQPVAPTGAPEIIDIIYGLDSIYGYDTVILTMADFSIAQAGAKSIIGYYCSIIPAAPGVDEGFVAFHQYPPGSQPVYSEEINGYPSNICNIMQTQLMLPNAYPFIPGGDYSLVTRVWTELGSADGTPKQFRYLSPGTLPGESISLKTSGSMGVEVKFTYTLLPGEEVNDTTTVDFLLTRIGPDSVNRGFNRVDYSLDNETYTTADISIPAPTVKNTENWPGELLETNDWPGEKTLTPDWPGESTLTPNWIGEFVSNDEYGNPIYDTSNPNIGNGGYFYNTQALPTIANGGYYYNTNATRNLENEGLYYNHVATLENGGLYNSYEKDYIHFYITPPEGIYPLDIYLRAANSNGSSLSYIKLTAIAVAPKGITLIGNPGVGYKNFQFSYSLDDPNDADIEAFNIQYSLDAGETFNDVTSFNNSGLASVSLDNGTYPPLQVRLINWVGSGPVSQFPQSLTIGTPAAPTLTVINPAASRLEFTVTKPLDDGGSVITSYSYRVDRRQIQYNIAYTGTTYTHAPADSFTVTQAFGSTTLVTGYEYTLYVKAINARGEGAEASLAGTPGFLPAAPIYKSVSQGDKKVTVSWTSGYTGGGQGSFIFNGQDLGGDYTYSAAGQSFSKDIFGAAGSAYSYSIKQYNQYGIYNNTITGSGIIQTSLAYPTITGFSATSPTSIALVIAPPTGADAWAPTGNGRFSNYEYSMSKGPGTTPNPLITNIITNYDTIEGLEPGSTYNIMVRALFYNGLKSGFSIISSIVVPTPPNPTEISYVGAYQDFLLLSVFNPTATSMNYNLHHTNGNVSGTLENFNGSGYIVICPGNANGINYSASQFMTLTTFASNIVSTSDQIDELTFNYNTNNLTRRLLPPKLLSLVNGLNSVTFSFKPALCQPGVTGITYVAIREDGTRTNLTNLTAPDGNGVITGKINLATGTYNNVALISRSTPLGDALYTSNTLTASPFSVPNAPTNLVATPANNSILVTFTVPSTNNIPITGYGYKTGAGSLRTFTTTVTGTTVTGVITVDSDNVSIVNGTNYNVSVFAYSIFEGTTYNGILSSPKTVKPSTVPSKIELSSIAATPSDKRISINISPLPNNGGNTITRYSYSLNAGGSYVLTNTATLPIAITSWLGSALINGNTYSLKLKAINAAGESTQSDTLQVKPATTPNAPTNLASINGDRSVIVTFDPPTDNGGEAITNYEYSTNDGITFKALSPASGLPTVSGVNGIALEITTVSNGSSQLVNGTPYVIKLRAVNIRGTGLTSLYTVGIPAAG